MSRRAGRHRVGEIVERRTGSQTPLWLDVESSQFYATVADETFRHKDGEEVKRWAIRKLFEISSFRWTPVIVVRGQHKDNEVRESMNGLDIHPERCHVEIDFRRTYFGVPDAKAPRGARMRELRWDDFNADVPAIDLVERSRSAIVPDGLDLNVLPHHGSGRGHFWDDKGEHVLPYSDEAFEGLRAIAAVVNQARADFKRLIMHKKSMQMLAAIGSRGLNAGPTAFAQIAATASVGKFDDRKPERVQHEDSTQDGNGEAEAPTDRGEAESGRDSARRTGGRATEADRPTRTQSERRRRRRR